jgi:hypothetical protein
VNADTQGEAFEGVQLGGEGWPGFEIDSMDIRIVGASGGSGATSEDFIDADTASVAANSNLTLLVTGMSGYFNGTYFTAADAGGAVPQSEYASALAFVGSLVNWSMGSAGADHMRATADVITLSAATGGDITGIVFPDDDPQSLAGGVPEGTLIASAGPASLSDVFLGAITVTLAIDVVADERAPLVSAIAVVPGNGVDGLNLYLNPIANSQVFVEFDWGAGGPPAQLDGGSLDCRLFDFGLGTETAALTYVSADPVNAGEFTVQGGDPYLLKALVGPGVTQPGSVYTLRILDLSAGGIYNSCNKPRLFLAVPIPPATNQKPLAADQHDRAAESGLPGPERQSVPDG